MESWVLAVIMVLIFFICFFVDYRNVSDLARETAKKEKDLRKQIKQIEERLDQHINRMYRRFKTWQNGK